MPVAFFVAGIEEAAFDLGVVERDIGLGVADFLLLLLGAVAVYVLVELKRMLFERHRYRGLDPIIMLLIQGRRFGLPLMVFTAFNLGMGLCEVTVILSFFGLLLFPVAYIALGVAFLRPEERLEFV